MIDFKTLTSALFLTSLLLVSNAFAMDVDETGAPLGRKVATAQQKVSDQSQAKAKYDFGNRFLGEAIRWYSEVVEVEKKMGTAFMDDSYLPGYSVTDGNRVQKQPTRWYYFSEAGVPKQSFEK